MPVKELAKTFGRFGIRVNALVPGAIAAGGFVTDPALAKHIPRYSRYRFPHIALRLCELLAKAIDAAVT